MTTPAFKLSRKGTLKEQWGFRKHWRSAHYHTGDVYQDAIQEQFRQLWRVDRPDPYLQFVRDVSSEWPHLRLLADFMEVGTDPLRWKDFYGADKNNVYTYPDDDTKRETARQQRVEKTNVSQIEYLRDGSCNFVAPYKTPSELRDGLAQLKQKSPVKQPAEKKVEVRLFVVEDLSRQVIEQLGYYFDINPEFFRAHAFDYVWFNIRDPFWDPPSLHVDMSQKDWYQVRFCRARYFSSRQSFNRGQDLANHFNIGRKLYEDENRAFWDTDSVSRLAKVLPVQPRKPGWVETIKGYLTQRQQNGVSKGSDVEMPVIPPAQTGHGVVENNVSGGSETPPTTTKSEMGETAEKIDGKVGLMRTKASLWKKRWEEGDCDVVVLLLDPTIKEGFQLWRGYRNWGPIPSAKSAVNRRGSLDESRVPSLTQISGNQGPPRQHEPNATEASFFEDLLYWAQRPEVMLGRQPSFPEDAHCIAIVALFRLVCADWLTLNQYIKTRLSQVDWEITHPKEFLTQSQIDTILNKLHTWRRLVPQFREMVSETHSRISKFPNHFPKDSSSQYPNPLSAFEEEFSSILAQLEEYERRIDRLTTVVTSAISIVDSRRVERLTLLAMFFVPMSLISSLFSMTEDITQLAMTFAYWAAASGGCLLMMLAWVEHRRRQSKKAR